MIVHDCCESCAHAMCVTHVCTCVHDVAGSMKSVLLGVTPNRCQ